jgi:thymidylate synthase
MSESRIHRAFPGGLEDLEIYRQEVVEGVHDHWINPREGKWTYTYHRRLFSFDAGGKTIDQINYIAAKLSQRPYSRRAQAITWNPHQDPFTDDPPCLQRLWCRITEEKDGAWILNMNSHWRSRDAYKAAFMNMFALTDLQRAIAQRISKLSKKPVGIGRYVDITDSFHIYGSYYNEFEKFLNLVSKRSFEDRTWTSEFAQSFFQEAKKKLQAEKRDADA